MTSLKKQSATPGSATVGPQSMIQVDRPDKKKKNKPVAKPHRELMRGEDPIVVWRVANQAPCPEGQTEVVSHEVMRLPTGPAFRDRPMCVNDDVVPLHADRGTVVETMKKYMGEGGIGDLRSDFILPEAADMAAAYEDEVRLTLESEGSSDEEITAYLADLDTNDDIIGATDRETGRVVFHPKVYPWLRSSDKLERLTGELTVVHELYHVTGRKPPEWHDSSAAQKAFPQGVPMNNAIHRYRLDTVAFDPKRGSVDDALDAVNIIEEAGAELLAIAAVRKTPLASGVLLQDLGIRSYEQETSFFSAYIRELESASAAKNNRTPGDSDIGQTMLAAMFNTINPKNFSLLWEGFKGWQGNKISEIKAALPADSNITKRLREYVEDPRHVDWLTLSVEDYNALYGENQDPDTDYVEKFVEEEKE